MVRIRYVYRITNLVNGKTYVGQHTVKRGRTITSDTYWGSGKVLCKAFKKYGKENFKKEILISGEFLKEEIDELEKEYIKLEKLNKKAEYNLAAGGEGGDLSEFINYKSQERNSKISKALKGKCNNPKGYPAFKGCHHSDETKQKMSEKAKTRVGNKNSSFGKYWWTNGKENVKSEICPDGFWKGRTFTGKQLENLKKSGSLHKGTKLSEETKKKMSEAHKK